MTDSSFIRIPEADAGDQTQILVKAQLSDPIAGISMAPESGRWGSSVEIAGFPTSFTIDPAG